jgi:hypothetical protein
MLKTVLSHFFSWLSDLKLLFLILLAATGFWTWFLIALALMFAYPIVNVMWIPLPLIIGVLVRYKSEKTWKRKSDVQRAEKEHAKTKRC